MSDSDSISAQRHEFNPCVGLQAGLEAYLETNKRKPENQKTVQNEEEEKKYEEKPVMPHGAEEQGKHI